MLLILGGLPGVGKTAVAAGLAREIGAVHLRIDSIEQALRNSGVDVSGPEGYAVAYAIAEDNLRLGRTRGVFVSPSLSAAPERTLGGHPRTASTGT